MDLLAHLSQGDVPPFLYLPAFFNTSLQKSFRGRVGSIALWDSRVLSVMV